MLQTVTIDTVPSPDSVDFDITLGKSWQKHLIDTVALQVSVDGIYIINHPTTPYLRITDLNDAEALQQADGTSLTDSRFNWVIGVAVNKSGSQKLLLNLPIGAYATDQGAIDDANKTAVTTFPKEFRGVVVLSARMPFRHRSTGGGTYENLSDSILSRDVIDLRGQQANVGAGGGLIPASTIFPDDTFSVYDNVDVTKELAFEVSGVATATTRTMTVPDENGTIALLPTQTSVASSSTPTPTGDSKENEYYLTALAVNATFAAPSGTPVNGNNLLIRIEDNGTARTLAWNAIYEPVGVTLPSTTVLGKKMYVGCIYNSTDSKWDVVSVINEA
jgi:hypothetical protein